MKKLKTVLFCILILSLSQTLFGQVTTSSDSRKEQDAAISAAARNAKVFGGKDDNGMIARTPTETRSNREIIRARAEVLANLEEINKRFEAPPEYLKKYKEYTKGKNSGIFRLFPERDCGNGKTISVADLDRCGDLPQVSGFGSKVSFRLSEFPADLITGLDFLFVHSDIQLSGNSLKAGNPLMETLIGEIGNLDLKDVNSKTQGVNFLAKWNKSKDPAGFATHRQSIEKGISDNGYKYSSSAPVKPNTVYALRSIAYYQRQKEFWNTDILIAFKIVGQQEDGSLIIIWRKLYESENTRIKN